jgi:hypothetical protein
MNEYLNVKIKRNYIESYKKERADNNRQNDIKYLIVYSTKTNNLQEIPNTFTVFGLTVAHTVIGNIKKITVILRVT